jgi:glycosyltransferase involved in cell wall biosynthesis
MGRPPAAGVARGVASVNVLVTLNSLIVGGSQLNAVDLAIAAQQHGVRSVIVGYRSTLPASGASMLDAANERGVALHVLDVATDTIAAAPALARLADEHDIDLVHAYGGWDLRAAFLGPCRWGRRPLVQTVYEMYVPSQTYPRQPLIVGTGYLLDEQQAGRPGPVDLISPPVDLTTDTPDHDASAFVTRFGLDPSRLRVVIVSRLATSMKERGVQQTIEAMASLDRDHVDLLVVGSGDAESRLRAAGDRVNGLLNRPAVTFLGAMHDPRGAYGVADVVIGMGSSAARALAFGKPLIVAGEHGWYRTFDRDTSAMLFRNSFWGDETDPDPVAGLSHQIRDLVDDADRRRDLGRYGREFAEGHFGLQVMAGRLAGVYARSLNSHRASSWLRDLRTEAGPATSWVQRRWRRLRPFTGSRGEERAC